MTGILITFMIVILAIVLLIYIGVRFSGNYREKENDKFYNQDGDHCYYERSIIEKKEFARKHPGVKGLRTFKRLFKHPDE